MNGILLVGAIGVESVDADASDISFEKELGAFNGEARVVPDALGIDIAIEVRGGPPLLPAGIRHDEAIGDDFTVGFLVVGDMVGSEEEIGMGLLSDIDHVEGDDEVLYGDGFDGEAILHEVSGGIHVGARGGVHLIAHHFGWVVIGEDFGVETAPSGPGGDLTIEGMCEVNLPSRHSVIFTLY